MPIQHFTPANRTTVNWAGGTSTELFIYPPHGSFADRNFKFRISTATVAVPESTFTFFAGITRHLMILKGELELIHEGRYTKTLKLFDQDTFSGEWTTRSKGQVTDFNLMLKDGATGSLTHHQVAPENGKVFTAKTDWSFVYLAAGTVTFGENQTAGAGDLLHLPLGTEVSLQARQPCDLIEINVQPA